MSGHGIDSHLPGLMFSERATVVAPTECYSDGVLAFPVRRCHTIVNVAPDSLSTQVHAELSANQWVVTGYLLAVALVIPITGWAMDRFGPKPV